MDNTGNSKVTNGDKKEDQCSERHEKQKAPASIKKNTVYNILKTSSSILFPLITFPYISRVLQVDSIGKINFGNSIVSYINLIGTLGIETYAIRECSKARDDQKKLDDTASQIYSINIFSTIIAYIVLTLLLLFWSKLFDYRKLIILQSAVVLFTTLGTNWINSAMEDFRYITIRTVAFQILSLVLMFLLVHQPSDYYIYALITVISATGSSLTNILYRRRYCRIRFTTHIEKRHLKPIFLLFAMILAQTIYVSTDQTMIGIFWGDHEVGLYSTAVKIYNLVNTMVASVYVVVMPQMSEAYEERDYKKINNLFTYAANVIITFGLPCIVGINVITNDIITVIAGEEYLGAAASLHILTIALTFSLLGGLFGNVLLLPSGRENISFRIAVTSAVVNFVTNLILIPHFGIAAAAGTTALVEGIALLMCLRNAEREVNKGVIFTLLKGPVAGCVAVMIIAEVIKLLHLNVFIETATIILFSAIAYFYILVKLNNELALNIKNIIKNKQTATIITKEGKKTE